MKNKLTQLLFILTLLFVSFLYDYHKITFKRPQSVHAWRQSDGGSLALNYYQNGMNFFQPRVHNLTSDGGTTGYSSTSEIPILYYTVALFYKVFGYHEFIYRLLNTLIFLTGLFYLFKGIKIKTGDSFWAAALSLYIFSSPVLVFYGNNFLSNSSALSMVFIGWFFFFRYTKDHRKPDLILTFLFFFLAGALKITALLSLFAVAGIFLLEFLFRVKVDRHKIFIHPVTFITGAAITVFLIIAWIVYASYYNHLHDTTYFSTTLFPVWSLSIESIQGVLSNINDIWLNEYFSRFSLILTGILLIINFIFFRKIPPFLILVQLFLFLQVLVFVLLQFWTLKDHDYYTINLFILPFFVILGSITLLKTLFRNKVILIIFKLMFALLVIFNIQYTMKRMEERYNGWMNRNYQKMQGFHEITPFLRETGIQPEDKIISFSDFSHVSLYLMNQPGWTRYTDARFNREEPVKYNQDSAGIQHSLDRGAKYLIINGFEDLYTNNYLRTFTQHLKSTYRNILIFEPNNPEKNFKFQEKEILYEAWCSAEKPDSTGKYFVDSTKQYLFEFNDNRTDEFSLSGSYSVALNRDRPYGMTHRLKDLKHGESIEVTVWRKGKEKGGSITAQAEDMQLFHKESNILTGKQKNDWVELRLEFFIPFEMENRELKVFIYSPDNELTYFDDFKITRYRSIVK